MYNSAPRTMTSTRFELPYQQPMRMADGTTGRPLYGEFHSDGTQSVRVEVEIPHWLGGTDRREMDVFIDHRTGIGQVTDLRSGQRGSMHISDAVSLAATSSIPNYPNTAPTYQTQRNQPAQPVRAVATPPALMLATGPSPLSSLAHVLKLPFLGVARGVMLATDALVAIAVGLGRAVQRATAATGRGLIYIAGDTQPAPERLV
jgi:hypothetical protein